MPMSFSVLLRPSSLYPMEQPQNLRPQDTKKAYPYVFLCETLDLLQVRTPLSIRRTDTETHFIISTHLRRRMRKELRHSTIPGTTSRPCVSAYVGWASFFRRTSSHIVHTRNSAQREPSRVFVRQFASAGSIRIPGTLTDVGDFVGEATDCETSAFSRSRPETSSEHFYFGRREPVRLRYSEPLSILCSVVTNWSMIKQHVLPTADLFSRRSNLNPTPSPLG